MIIFQPLKSETREKDLFYTRQLLDATETAFKMKNYRQCHLSSTYPFKVLVNLVLLFLIWQPD